jgi:hypothetical protein
MKASEVKIPPMAHCRIEPISVATPKDRMDTDAETEARIRQAAFGMYICWPPEADDCFHICGMGPGPSAAYVDMLDDLREHYHDRFESEVEALLFDVSIRECTKQRLSEIEQQLKRARATLLQQAELVKAAAGALRMHFEGMVAGTKETDRPASEGEGAK